VRDFCGSWHATRLAAVPSAPVFDFLLRKPYLLPGLSSQRANLSDPYEGKSELLKIAKEYERDPSDKNRKRYINLASEVAEARVNK